MFQESMIGNNSTVRKCRRSIVAHHDQMFDRCAILFSLCRSKSKYNVDGFRSRKRLQGSFNCCCVVLVAYVCVGTHNGRHATCDRMIHVCVPFVCAVTAVATVTVVTVVAIVTVITVITVIAVTTAIAAIAATPVVGVNPWRIIYR